MQISFPLFVRAKDSGEIAAFHSLDELQDHIEKIDVENQEYEVWDKDGVPVQLTLRERALWLRAEATSQTNKSDQLRTALLRFGESVGVRLSESLPTSAFLTALDQVRAEQEARQIARSTVRRFVSRFKH